MSETEDVIGETRALPESDSHHSDISLLPMKMFLYNLPRSELEHELATLMYNDHAVYERIRDRVKSQEHSRRVFVKNIPLDMSYERFSDIMGEYGSFVKIDYLRDNDNNFRGIAFVTYETFDPVEHLLSHPIQLDDTMLYVSIAREQKLPQGGNMLNQRGSSNFGPSQLSNQRAHSFNSGSAHQGNRFPNSNSGGFQNSGNMGSRNQSFSNGQQQQFHSQQAPRQQPSASGSSIDPLKVFVRSLPEGTNEDRLMNLFGSYGKIDSVQVLRDRNTNDLKNHGFVLFNDPQVAKSLVQMGSIEVEGRQIILAHANARQQSQQGAPVQSQQQGGNFNHGTSHGNFQQRISNGYGGTGNQNARRDYHRGNRQSGYPQNGYGSHPSNGYQQQSHQQHGHDASPQPPPQQQE